MAQIKFSGIGVTEARGKLSGTVFSRGRSGAILRNSVKPTNPRTNKQLLTRAKLSLSAASWKNLTAEQRLMWQSAASTGTYNLKNKLGETVVQNGFGAFTAINAALSVVDWGGNTPPQATPPALDDTAETMLLSLTGAAAVPALSLQTSEALPADTYLVISASAQQSQGVSRPSVFRVISTPSETGTTISILSAYTAVWGTLQAGKQVFVRAYVLSATVGIQHQSGAVSCIIAT